jgi:hypothetical protein
MLMSKQDKAHEGMPWTGAARIAAVALAGLQGCADGGLEDVVARPGAEVGMPELDVTPAALSAGTCVWDAATARATWTIK